MTTHNASDPVTTFDVQVVSAGGAVVRRPLESALAELVDAVTKDSGDSPYGAVLTCDCEPLRPDLVWQTVLAARQRVGSVFAKTHGSKRGSSLGLMKWPDDINVIIDSSLVDDHKYYDVILDELRSSRQANDVLLLLTQSFLQELMPAEFSGTFRPRRCLIRVIREPATRVFAPRSSDDHSREDSNDDGESASEATLKWRQSFVKNVPTLTAEEIAEAGGHQAKNKSATAYRWVNDGKIFSVKYGGQLLYPAFQFRHGSPLPIVERILKVLAEDPTGWDRAMFFATPNAYLGNAKPMDRINDKELHEKLVAIADRHSHPADVF
jgi:hypothetical protein